MTNFFKLSSFLPLHCLLKKYGILFAFLTLTAGPVVADWSAWFSEEDGHQSCPSTGINGWDCRGRYCDDSRIHCRYGHEAGIANTWAGTAKPLPWVSEEGSGEVKCPDNHLVTDVQCHGSYCDNLELSCTRSDYNLQNHRWWGHNFGSRNGFQVSEEGGSVTWDHNSVLIGLRCDHDYCDNKYFMIADIGLPFIGNAEGEWVPVTSSGGQNQIRLEKTENYTLVQSRDRTREVATTIAGKIGVGVNLGIVNFEASVDPGTTTTTGNNSSTQQTNSSGATNECIVNTDFGQFSANTTLFQWRHSIKVGAATFTVNTCEKVCGLRADFDRGGAHHKTSPRSLENLRNQPGMKKFGSCNPTPPKDLQTVSKLETTDNKAWLKRAGTDSFFKANEEWKIVSIDNQNRYIVLQWIENVAWTLRGTFNLGTGDYVEEHYRNGTKERTLPTVKLKQSDGTTGVNALTR